MQPIVHVTSTWMKKHPISIHTGCGAVQGWMQGSVNVLDQVYFSGWIFLTYWRYCMSQTGNDIWASQVHQVCFKIKPLWADECGFSAVALLYKLLSIYLVIIPQTAKIWWSKPPKTFHAQTAAGVNCSTCSSRLDIGPSNFPDLALVNLL